MEKLEFPKINDCQSKMQYPELRNELIRVLYALSCAEYQRAVWINHEHLDGIEYDCFDFAIHFLFDDTVLGEDIEKAIGVFIFEDEVNYIRKVISALDGLLYKYGTNKDDSFYIGTPEWSIILVAANEAYNYLTQK